MTTNWGPPPFGGKGFLMVDDPWHRVWVHFDENGLMQKCDQTLVDPILEANKAKMNASIGQRFGTGKIVASIPLPLYYDKIVPARQQKDTAYINRILNDSDYEKLRTFGGRL